MTLRRQSEAAYRLREQLRVSLSITKLPEETQAIASCVGVHLNDNDNNPLEAA